MDFQRYLNLVYNLDWLKIETEQCVISPTNADILEAFVKHLEDKSLAFAPIAEGKVVTIGYPTHYYFCDGLHNKIFDRDLTDANSLLKTVIDFLVAQFPLVKIY